MLKRCTGQGVGEEHGASRPFRMSHSTQTRRVHQTESSLNSLLWRFYGSFITSIKLNKWLNKLHGLLNKSLAAGNSWLLPPALSPFPGVQRMAPGAKVSFIEEYLVCVCHITRRGWIKMKIWMSINGRWELGSFLMLQIEPYQRKP